MEIIFTKPARNALKDDTKQNPQKLIERNKNI